MTEKIRAEGDETYFVLDDGTVQFIAESELDAKVFLNRRGRGVLCKVLYVSITQMLRGHKGDKKTV